VVIEVVQNLANKIYWEIKDIVALRWSKAALLTERGFGIAENVL
jgi:hypothetical protein